MPGVVPAPAFAQVDVPGVAEARNRLPGASIEREQDIRDSGKRRVDP
jgi:hypothetical protein